MTPLHLLARPVPSCPQHPKDPIGFLPYHTRIEINKTGTPQALAYEWLLGDPDIGIYSEERRIQRFAMATLYYATNGDYWTNNASWLNYSVPECEWYFNNNPDAMEWEVGDLAARVLSMVTRGNANATANSTLLREGLRLATHLKHLWCGSRTGFHALIW